MTGGGGGEEWTGTVMSMHRGCVDEVHIFCAWYQMCSCMLYAYLVVIPCGDNTYTNPGDISRIPVESWIILWVQLGHTVTRLFLDVFLVHEFELQAASLQGHQQPHCKATGSLTARSQAASLQGHRQPHCKVTGSLTAGPQAASLQGHGQAASLQGHQHALKQNGTYWTRRTG